jgi:hypothetical protein
MTCLLAGSGALQGCTSDLEAGAQFEVTTRQQQLTVAEKQARLNRLYDMSNDLTIDITMSASEWETLKTEVPVGGICNFSLPSNTDRFPAIHGAQVAIKDSFDHTTVANFPNVQISKKSFCGSVTTTSGEKPSLKLKFLGVGDEDAIGSKHLVLNNSKQDPAYVRQCLGYRMYGIAGLPRSRCNFAKVRVNGVPVNDGVYVNVEPIRERYLDNPDNRFNVTSGGNLYEFDFGDDFTTSRLGFIDVESVSVFTKPTDPNYQNDLKAAVSQIDNFGRNGVFKVFDTDNFRRMWAMEFFLLHNDGFTTNTNNTYFYNDARAVAGVPNADLNQVRFKMIPWGLDQVLNSAVPAGPRWEYHRMDNTERVASLIRADPQFALRVGGIKDVLETVFTRARLEGEVKDYIDAMQSRLTALGGANVAEIAKVRFELKKARAAGLHFVGYGRVPLYWLDSETGDAIHATSDAVGGGVEVTHQPPADASADQWIYNEDGSSLTLRNQGSGRYLVCPKGTPAANGRYVCFAATSTTPYSGSRSYWTTAPPLTDIWLTTGKFMFYNPDAAYGGVLHSATNNATPSGRQRIESTQGFRDFTNGTYFLPY